MSPRPSSRRDGASPGLDSTAGARGDWELHPAGLTHSSRSPAESGTAPSLGVPPPPFGALVSPVEGGIEQPPAG